MNKLKLIQSLQKGVAFIEIAVILPVLLFLIAVSLEAANIIKTDEYAATISREMASIAFRDCSDETGTKLQACLNQVRDLINISAQNLAPGTNLTLSYYFCNDSDIVETPVISFTSSSYPSKFSRSTNQAYVEGLTPILPCDQKVIIIGEAFVPYNSLFAGLSRYAGLVTDVKYEASVI